VHLGGASAAAAVRARAAAATPREFGGADGGLRLRRHPRGAILLPVFGKKAGARPDARGTSADAAGRHRDPNPVTGQGYGVNDPPVRIHGEWSLGDMKQALLGHPPRGLGSPDLHHAGQMPGSGIHEVLPVLHRGNPAFHPNTFNQGVTPEMRIQDRQLHWWYRAREQGADDLLPNWVYDD
ncbi:MAG: hypothetical protein ACOYM9_20110, partial [Bradymonadia bacterium]